MFVDREGKMTVYDTSFENTREASRLAMQGDILYSDGGVVIARYV